MATVPIRGLTLLCLLVDVQHWRSDGLIVSSRSPLLQRSTRVEHTPLLRPLLSLRSTTSDNETVPKKKKRKKDRDETGGISAVDARVLESMLKDDKLDLETEENMRKLLERGIKKEVNAPNGSAEQKEESSNEPESSNDSEFSSTLFKTLAETKMWKALQKKAEDIVDSAKLYVANRVERDSGLVLALGAFAWDRAVKDVSRALPAATSASKKTATFLLSTARNEPNATDAFLNDANSAPKSVFEEMVTPMDEIKNVASSVRAILLQDEYASGTMSMSNRRSLRTAAPAGQAANGVRLMRAYQRRRKIQIGEANPRALVSGVVDTAYELQRDLKSETNQPGYKTVQIRNAIEAGAETTSRLLGSVKQNLLLGAAKRKEYVKQLKQANAYKSDIIDDLIREQNNLVGRLEMCIEEPEECWLKPEYVEIKDNHAEFQEDGIRDLVRSMIEKRDEIEADISTSKDSFEDVMSQLQRIKSYVEELQISAQKAVSLKSSEALGDNILGVVEYGADAIMLRLDTIEKNAAVDEIEVVSLLTPSKEAEAVEDEMPNDSVINRESYSSGIADVAEVMPNNIFEVEVEIESNGKVNNGFDRNTDMYFSNGKNYEDGSKEEAIRSVTPDVVEAIQEATVINTSPSRVNDFQDATISEVNENAFINFDTIDDSDDNLAAAVVEVITDADFDSAVGETKEFKFISNEVEDESEENLRNYILDLLLRSFDILFFVVEKTFTVGLPRAVETGKTAQLRLDNVAKSGMGSKGWKTIGNAQEGSNRY